MSPKKRHRIENGRRGSPVREVGGFDENVSPIAASRYAILASLRKLLTYNIICSPKYPLLYDLKNAD